MYVCTQGLIIGQDAQRAGDCYDSLSRYQVTRRVDAVRHA